MRFNPESTKQAQETIFSRNLKRHNVSHVNCQKPWRVFLDFKLTFMGTLTKY